MLDVIDTLVRGAAIGVALTTALVTVVDQTRRRCSGPLVALAISVSCYLLASAPLADNLPDTRIVHNIGIAMMIGAIFVPVALTWLVVVIFVDPPHDRWPWTALALATIPAALIADWFPAISALRGVSVLLLYLALFYVALSTATDDLVQKRRRFRRAFLAAMAALGVAISLVEILLGYTRVPDSVLLLQASVFLVLAMALSAWMLSPAEGIWPDPRNSPPSKPEPKDARDAQVLARLEAAINDEIWRREGLTIGALAEAISLPEHRLRSTINRGLGHRNLPVSSMATGLRPQNPPCFPPIWQIKRFSKLLMIAGLHRLGRLTKHSNR